MGTPFPYQMKRKTAPNISNKVSIPLHEFPHWIFRYHCRLLTSSADLRVASTSVRSRPYFNVNLLQKGVRRRSTHQKMNGWELLSHALPPHYTTANISLSLKTSWRFLPKERNIYFIQQYKMWSFSAKGSFW